MKRYSKYIHLLLILAFTAGLALSSCRVFMGDPRKNCNHPDHGDYIREQRMKKEGY